MHKKNCSSKQHVAGAPVAPHGEIAWLRSVKSGKDKNLTKAHVKYLERELYQLADRAIGTLTVKNGNIPSGSSLPESDQHSMSEFLQNIIFVMETLGLGYFPTAVDVPESDKLVSSYEKREWSNPANHEGMEFFLPLPDKLDPSGKERYKSFMTVRNGFYVLKAGSFVRKEARSSFAGHAYYNLWQQITKSDAVKSHANSNLLVTVRDIEFKSPSGAGAIVQAGQTNGKKEWLRVSDELPLAHCEAEVTRRSA